MIGIHGFERIYLFHSAPAVVTSLLRKLGTLPNDTATVAAVFANHASDDGDDLFGFDF